MTPFHKLADVSAVLQRGALGHFFDSQGYPRDTSYSVPPILHFIWIGSTLPDKYRDNVLGFLRVNSHYEINLWVDHPCQLVGVKVRDLSQLTLFNGDLFRAEQNLGGRADILRYEVVWHEGGIYSDIDAIAVKPLDANFSSAFVCAILHSYHNITNACFGFPKHSAFLHFVRDKLRENAVLCEEGDVVSRTGPTFFTTCFLSFSDFQINIIDQSYTTNRSENSYTYHTHDANWISLGTA